MSSTSPGWPKSVLHQRGSFLGTQRAFYSFVLRKLSKLPLNLYVSFLLKFLNTCLCNHKVYCTSSNHLVLPDMKEVQEFQIFQKVSCWLFNVWHSQGPSQLSMAAFKICCQSIYWFYISHMEKVFKTEELWFGGATDKFLALILCGNDNKKVAVPFVSQSHDVIDRDY